MLTSAQRAQLLTVARESIRAVLEGRRPEWNADDFDEVLRRPSGVFVTLRLRETHDLRGCIGSIQAQAPLYLAVSAAAQSAAFRDPRFYPLSPAELADVELEISVMSPIEPLGSVDDIVLGRDGLIVSRGRNAGLLLPQVATEYAWDRDTFLSQTCVKAGLPPGSWRSPETRIERFSAEVFGE